MRDETSPAVAFVLTFGAYEGNADHALRQRKGDYAYEIMGGRTSTSGENETRGLALVDLHRGFSVVELQLRPLAWFPPSRMRAGGLCGIGDEHVPIGDIFFVLLATLILARCC